MAETPSSPDDLPAADDAIGEPVAAKGESYTWPLIAIALIITPQLAIPGRDRIGPPLAIPVIEIVALLLLIGIAALPGPVSQRAHGIVLSLFGVLALANAGAALHLVSLVLDVSTGKHFTPGRLLTAGALVLFTNVVTFALLYWQLDGGGPAARDAGPGRYRDFQFPQSISPELAPPGWRPLFADYLYVAFTNIVAFSPTDTMPLTRNAKALMALQALISAAVLIVVLARVINILPT
jgi:uncharacterized membrane protein